MAKHFPASLDLKDAMAEAGVVDMPTIYFLDRLIERGGEANGPIVYADSGNADTSRSRTAAIRHFAEE